MTAPDQKIPPAWLLRWLPLRRHEERNRRSPKLPAIKQVVAQTGRTPEEK